MAQPKKSSPPSSQQVLIDTPQRPLEFTHQEDQLSDDPNILILEAQDLQQKSTQYFWLLGQRLYKIKKILKSQERITINQKSYTDFEEICKHELNATYHAMQKFVAFYLNVDWEEVRELKILQSVAVKIGTIKSPQIRQKLFAQAEAEQWTLEKTQQEVKEINEAGRRQTENINTKVRSGKTLPPPPEPEIEPAPSREPSRVPNEVTTRIQKMALAMEQPDTHFAKWNGANNQFLLKEMQSQSERVQKAVDSGNPQEIRKQAAILANIMVEIVDQNWGFEV